MKKFILLLVFSIIILINNNGTYSLVNGAYVGYKYKKLGLRAECAEQDGYLASGRNGGGFYLQSTYDLLKKLQLIARFDQFDPDRAASYNLIQEYTVGGNYFFTAQNIKLLFDLVYVNNQLTRNSEKVVLQTQYTF